MDIIQELIHQLKLFSPGIIEFQPPADTRDINDFEEKHKMKLPLDYTNFLQKHNGVSLMGADFYGIDTRPLHMSLDKAYSIEHYEVGNPMPGYLFPFSPDGFGNHYCFDIRFSDPASCRIVFWQHDFIYTGDDGPEITNDSFAEWMQEVMIDWTLEDYDHDGSRKSEGKGPLL